MNKKNNASTINLVGQKFNRLTVIRYDHSDNGAVWLCKCDCGNYITAKGWALKSGKTKSCGCYHKELAQKLGQSKEKHGQSESKLYAVWRAMKARCNNKNDAHYDRYGGRGIEVCQEWQDDFQNFYDWSINNGYKEGLTIDRINNDGNYEPDNCRWVTMGIQNQNKHKPKLKEYYKNQYGTFKCTKLDKEGV